MERRTRQPVDGSRRVAAVEVGAETETARGWSYRVRVVWMDDAESDHDVSLSWHDHDHWSGGTAPPERVIAAVVRAAGDALGREKLPARFDAASVRRWVPGLDERVAR
ncbi:MAG: hypothetical protein DHS20C14_04250 [Phycisphaeraceae bacterium]|nr:MAG: hypothetical protein DHS20C14_04250 [Phycisphaeraceae bacterium]